MEYMAQQVCERAGIPYTASYTEGVNALKDIHKVLDPRRSEYDFAKSIFDIGTDIRYNHIANKVNEYKVNHPDMRKAVRDRLNEDLRILRGIERGGKRYG